MPIKHWPHDERPREKLLRQGANTLSVAELLAILLRTGSKGKTALDLARELLANFGNLYQLFNTDLASFCQISGLGKAKYLQLQAAQELNRRFLLEQIKRQDVLENPLQTRMYLLSKLANKQRETFACLFLNSQHQVIGYVELFQGTINQADIYPREIIKSALQHNAAAVIIAHNHPSGSLQPSVADCDLTKRLKGLLNTIDIYLLDHIIVAGNQTISLAEQGLI